MADGERPLHAVRTHRFQGSYNAEFEIRSGINGHELLGCGAVDLDPTIRGEDAEQVATALVHIRHAGDFDPALEPTVRIVRIWRGTQE